MNNKQNWLPKELRIGTSSYRLRVFNNLFHQVCMMYANDESVFIMACAPTLELAREKLSTLVAERKEVNVV